MNFCTNAKINNKRREYSTHLQKFICEWLKLRTALGEELKKKHFENQTIEMQDEWRSRDTGERIRSLLHRSELSTDWKLICESDQHLWYTDLFFHHFSFCPYSYFIFSFCHFVEFSFMWPDYCRLMCAHYVKQEQYYYITITFMYLYNTFSTKAKPEPHARASHFTLCFVLPRRETTLDGIVLARTPFSLMMPKNSLFPHFAVSIK